jgi:hypothetical protein
MNNMRETLSATDAEELATFDAKRQVIFHNLAFIDPSTAKVFADRFTNLEFPKVQNIDDQTLESLVSGPRLRRISLGLTSLTESQVGILSRHCQIPRNAATETVPMVLLYPAHTVHESGRKLLDRQIFNVGLARPDVLRFFSGDLPPRQQPTLTAAANRPYFSAFARLLFFVVSSYMVLLMFSKGCDRINVP